MSTQERYANMKRFDYLMKAGDEYFDSGEFVCAGKCYDKAAILWQEMVNADEQLTEAEQCLFMQVICLN